MGKERQHFTRSSAVRGRRNLCPTVLEALAQRVPSDGPKVDVKAIAPWEVPNWVAQTTYMGTVAPYIRKAWVRDLTVSYEGMSTMIIHTVAKVVSRHVGDLTVVGGVAATFSTGGSAWTNCAWTIGSELTQFDADAYALARTAETLAHYYTEEVPPPANIFILSPSAPALQAVKNPRSKKAHSFALRFHKALTLFSLFHRDTGIFLVWAPIDDELVGSRLAHHLAAEACCRIPPMGWIESSQQLTKRTARAG